MSSSCDHDLASALGFGKIEAGRLGLRLSSIPVHAPWNDGTVYIGHTNISIN